MKLCFLFSLLVTGSIALHAQNRLKPPTSAAVIPGKDPVVVFDYLSSGATKTYSWTGGTVKFLISGNNLSGNKVNLIFNGTAALRSAEVPGKEEAHNKKGLTSFKLIKGLNKLALTADQSSKLDSFTVNIMLSDSDTEYSIMDK